MVSKRYGLSGVSAEQPDVRPAADRTGAFGAPSGPIQYQSMLDASPAQTDAPFVYDDEPAWSQPVSALPVRAPIPKNRPAQPAPVRGSNGGKGGWKAYLYVALITISVLGMAMLGVMMMPQLSGYFWKDFGNYAFINGELLRYDPAIVATYKQYRSYMDRDVNYPGVFVDGIHVGDMTIEQAQAGINSSVEQLKSMEQELSKELSAPEWAYKG